MRNMRDNDWRKSRYEKAKADEAFVMSALTLNCGGGTSGATLEDDMKKHIDVLWDSPKKGILKIDVKSVKQNRTNDHTPDDTINWLEIQNTLGENGWLKGEADYIAFKTFTDVIFVKRQKLLDWTLKMIEGKEIVHETPTDYYIPYNRSKWGNKDIVVKCRTSDLRKLAHFTISNVWYDKIKRQ